MFASKGEKPKKLWKKLLHKLYNPINSQSLKRPRRLKICCWRELKSLQFIMQSLKWGDYNMIYYKRLILIEGVFKNQKEKNWYLKFYQSRFYDSWNTLFMINHVKNAKKLVLWIGGIWVLFKNELWIFLGVLGAFSAPNPLM